MLNILGISFASKLQTNSCFQSSIHTRMHTHGNVDIRFLGAVHMSRASPANRADLSHENLYFSTT